MRKLFAILVASSMLTMSGVAQAAPVSVSAVLGIAIQGLAPLTVAGGGIVDITAGTITVPAGLVSLSGTILVPVTGVSAITSLSVMTLSNLAGTFSIGGVTAMAPGEVCTGAATVAPNGSGGAACNIGGGLGGVMALTGTVFVNVIPNVVVIPVNLNVALIGQGGSTNNPFLIDAAAWSTGTGLVNTGVNIISATTGSGPGLPLTLVSPTFVSALGNLLPIFATLTLTVPEPGSLLLIGTGIAGLALLGSRRK